jgi:hypothetical protein
MSLDRGSGQDRLDLSALDPLADADRFELILGRLRRAAAPAMRSRQAALGVWGFLCRWRRPIYATAGLLAASSLLVLAKVPPAATTDPTLAEIVGVPGSLAPWTRSAELPPPASLLQMELDDR